MTMPETPLDAARRHYDEGRAAEAVAAIAALPAGQAADPETLHLFALSLHALGRHREALDAMRRVLAVQPDDPVLLTNAGAVAVAAGEGTAAEAFYRRAIAVSPLHVDAYNNLAVLLERTQRLHEAEILLEKAGMLAPDSAAVQVNLGNVLVRLARSDEAVECYERALRLTPDRPELYNNLGNALRSLDRHAEACAAFDRALALNPGYAEAHYNRGLVLAGQNATDAAAAAMDRALSLRPDSGFRLARAGLMPIVAASEEDIRRWRRSFERGFDAMIAEGVRIEQFPPPASAMTFHMTYQGENDRDLFAKVGGFYAQASPDLSWTAPHLRGRRPVRARRRVGLVSHYLGEHAVAATLVGLLQELPRAHMELIVFPVGTDNLAPEIRAAADGVVALTEGLRRSRERIAEADCDILLYSDIGMHASSYWLAFSRLAPVQCAIWGHPDTTGLDSVDYFVSSDLAEPPDAQAHYRERLVRLDGVQTCYRRPALPQAAKARRDFGLPEDATLYLCPQSLFKLHPAMDPALAAILRGDPKGRLVLFHHPGREVTQSLADRLRGACPDVADRIQFLPRMRFADFLSVMALADVVLDTWPFGGGNTSYQAIAFGKPHVTLPHRFIRGRGTWALYRHMDLPDCVAEDAGDYVRIALALGADPARRATVAAAIRERSPVVFDDRRVVHALTRFLLEVPL